MRLDMRSVHSILLSISRPFLTSSFLLFPSFLLSFFSLFSFFSVLLSSIFSYPLHIIFTFSSHCLPQALQGEGIDLPSTFLQDVIDRLIGILLPSKTKKGTKGAKGGAENTNEVPTSRTTATTATATSATSAASAASASSTTVRFDERVRQGAAVGLANVLGCGLGCGIR